MGNGVERPGGRRWRAASLAGVGAACSCAAARLRARPGRVVLAALGVAVSVITILVIAFASTVAGDVALRRSMQALPPGQQAVISAYDPDEGVGVDDLHAIDQAIRGAVGGSPFARTRSLVEFRALSNKQGDVFRVAGVDDLSSATRLVAGRWPASCTDQRCEVVAMRSPDGSAVDLDLDPTLGLDIVGQVIAADPLLLPGGFAPEAGEIVLLSDSIDGITQLTPLQYIRRSFGWVTPVRVTDLRVTDVGHVLRTMARIPTAIDVVGIEVRGPAAELAAGRDRAGTAGNRLAVPAAASLTLFAAFAVFAGLGLRPDHRRAVAVLARRGAAPVALTTFSVLETGWVVVTGGLVGVGAGLPIGHWLAERAGSDGGDALTRVLAASTVRNIAAFLVVAWFVLLTVVRTAEPLPVRRRRLRGLDVAGLAAGAMILVLVDRGAPSPAALATRPDSGVAAIPVLGAVVLVAVACRVVPWAIHGWAALVPRSRPLLKMSLANATARPLRPLATASLIALTVMFGFFGLGYRSTLLLGARDQAAFVVPYDFRIVGGPALVQPREVQPASTWAGVAPDLIATPVLRRATTLRVAGVAGTTAEVVGLDPATLPALHGWRKEFGRAPSTYAAQLDTSPLDTIGTAIPADATTLRLATVDLDATRIAAVIARTDGSWHEVDAAYESAAASMVTLLPGDAGGRLVGFRIAQDREAASRTEHHIGEGDTSVGALEVSGSIRSVSADETPIEMPWATLQSSLGEATAVDGGGVRLTAAIQGTSALLVPHPEAIDAPLPAVVDPVTAATARGGVVTFETSSGRLQVRPVGIVQRFPGSPARFAVVDVDGLQPRLDLVQPGFGTANEVWIGAGSAAAERAAAAALRDDPRLGVLEIARRTERLHALESDPLARSTLAILVGSALAAAALAGLALVVGSLADATDERALHRTLALEGVSARRLVGFQAAKTLGIVVMALPVGVVGGAAILQLVTRTVAVTAGATVPEPALRLSLPMLLAWATVLAFVGVAACASWLGAFPLRRVLDSDLLRGGE